MVPGEKQRYSKWYAVCRLETKCLFIEGTVEIKGTSIPFVFRYKLTIPILQRATWASITNTITLRISNMLSYRCMMPSWPVQN